MQQDKMSQYASEIKEVGAPRDFAEEIEILKDVSNPIRLVDTPNGVERYYVSWILCDDDKKRPFNVENDNQGKSVLLKMLGDRNSFFKGGILESIKDEITKKGKYG